MNASPAQDPSATGQVRELDVSPITKVVEVACSPADTFDAFTRRIDRWWPLAGFSLGGADAVSVAIEPRVGGRVFERERDGTERLWGTVTAWDEPTRLAFTWHVGRAAETAQTVEVTFAPSAFGTRVRLEHFGWEHFGAGADKARDEYDRGWEEVFVRRFAAHADPARSAEAAPPAG